jgi:hypothetical protein
MGKGQVAVVAAAVVGQVVAAASKVAHKAAAGAQRVASRAGAASRAPTKAWTPAAGARLLPGCQDTAKHQRSRRREAKRRRGCFHR